MQYGTDEKEPDRLYPEVVGSKIDYPGVDKKNLTFAAGQNRLLRNDLVYFIVGSNPFRHLNSHLISDLGLFY